MWNADGTDVAQVQAATAASMHAAADRGIVTVRDATHTG
jgi:hypothetical protein